MPLNSAFMDAAGEMTRIEINVRLGAGNEVTKMHETRLTIADIILIAGTRIVLGAGIGLLVSTRLNNDQRKAAGLALILVGGLTTIPLAMGVIGKQRAGFAELREAA